MPNFGAWWAGALLLLPMWAVTPDEIIDQLATRRYHADPGVEITIDQLEQLVAAYPRISFVALADTPPDGSDLFAADLLNRLGTGTVVVLTPEEAGVVSFDYDDATLNRAIDSMTSSGGDSYAVDFELFADALESPPEEAAGEAAAGEGGSWWPWVVAALILGGIVWLVFGSSRRQLQGAERRLEDARAEIRQQMAVIANQILAFSDRPDADRHPGAMGHFRTASDTFHGAEDRLAGADNLGALEELADDLDRARWELEAATALVNGDPLPPTPTEAKPESCFFDPTHGAGVEEAEISTPAGKLRVMVCRADAEKLRGGEAPLPRNISMGPISVPAPTAPRHYGGHGMDALDVFSILVGGMSRGTSYDWRTPRTRRVGIPGLPSSPRARRMGSASGRRAQPTMGRARRRR